MHSKFILLAGLASYAVGLPQPAPVEERGLLGGILGGILDPILDPVLDLGGLLVGLLGGGGNPGSILTGLNAQAAAAIQAGALGCTAGTVGSGAIAQLKAWLNGAGANINAALRADLLNWCNGGSSAKLSVDVIAGLAVLLPTCAEIASAGDLYVTVNGILSTAELEAVAVLNAAAQASLSAFISVHAQLDADIKAALSLCAGGGIATSLSADIVVALKAWLNASTCPLDAGLKASVLAWVNGSIGAGVVAIGDLSDGAVSAVSIAASLLALVGESGVLVASAQSSLTAFLASDLAVGLEADILAVLHTCANGGLAASVVADLRATLAAWLVSSDCNLGAELQAVVMLWLSLAVPVGTNIVSLTAGVVSDITALVTGTLASTLGGHVTGILSVLLGGGSCSNLGLHARAEIIAILCGATNISLPSVSISIIVEWITGCVVPGGPVSATPTATSSPTATPTWEIVTVTATVTDIVCQ